MALRRGDWETGDVICHECHLTAPPTPPHPIPPHSSPSASSSTSQPFSRTSPLNFLFLFLFLLHRRTAPVVCLLSSSFRRNDLFERASHGHISSSSRAILLSLGPSPLDITLVSYGRIYISGSGDTVFPT